MKKGFDVAKVSEAFESEVQKLVNGSPAYEVKIGYHDKGYHYHLVIHTPCYMTDDDFLILIGFTKRFNLCFCMHPSDREIILW